MGDSAIWHLGAVCNREIWAGQLEPHLLNNPETFIISTNDDTPHCFCFVFFWQ